MPSPPRLNHRPSYAQREAYRDALTDAYADGRLDDETFAARVARVDSAHLLRDLEDLVADVPRPDIPRPLKVNQMPRTNHVPLAPDSVTAANGSAAGSAVRPTRRLGSRRSVTALSIAAVCVGIAASTLAFHLPGGSTDEPSESSAALPPELDGADEAGYLSYGYIKGVLDGLGDKRIVGLDLRYTGASAQTVTAGGRAARTVEFDQDLRQHDDPEDKTDFEADEADFKSFGANDLRPAVLYAAVKRAPGLLAARADGVRAADLRTAAVMVQRSESDPAVGQKKRALFMRVMVESRDPSGGSGVNGSVEWSADGKQLLGVRVD